MNELEILHYRTGSEIAVQDLAESPYAVALPKGFAGRQKEVHLTFDSADEVQEWMSANKIPQSIVATPESVESVVRRFESEPDVEESSRQEATKVARARWVAHLSAIGAGDFDDFDSMTTLVDSGALTQSPADPYWLYRSLGFGQQSPALAGFLPDFSRFGYGQNAKGVASLFTTVTLCSDLFFRGNKYYLWGIPYVKIDLVSVGWGNRALSGADQILL